MEPLSFRNRATSYYIGPQLDQPMHLLDSWIQSPISNQRGASIEKFKAMRFIVQFGTHLVWFFIFFLNGPKKSPILCILSKRYKNGPLAGLRLKAATITERKPTWSRWRGITNSGWLRISSQSRDMGTKTHKPRQCYGPTCFRMQFADRQQQMIKKHRGGERSWWSKGFIVGKQW